MSLRVYRYVFVSLLKRGYLKRKEFAPIGYESVSFRAISEGPFSEYGPTLKGRNLLPGIGNKFFPFRADHFSSLFRRAKGVCVWGEFFQYTEGLFQKRGGVGWGGGEGGQIWQLHPLTTKSHSKPVCFLLILSRHITSKWRCINVDAMWSLRIDVDATWF